MDATIHATRGTRGTPKARVSVTAVTDTFYNTKIEINDDELNIFLTPEDTHSLWTAIAELATKVPHINTKEVGDQVATEVSFPPEGSVKLEDLEV